jgi:hypothetical protein
MFKKQLNGDGQKKKGTNTSNIIYFSFAIACDNELASLIGNVGIKWTRAGGSRLSRSCVGHQAQCHPVDGGQFQLHE